MINHLSLHIIECKIYHKTLVIQVLAWNRHTCGGVKSADGTPNRLLIMVSRKTIYFPDERGAVSLKPWKPYNIFIP